MARVVAVHQWACLELKSEDRPLREEDVFDVANILELNCAKGVNGRAALRAMLRPYRPDVDNKLTDTAEEYEVS